MVKRLSYALTRPVCLLMLATAFVAGLLSAWWLFPLGVLLWLGMVFSLYNSESARLNQRISERAALPYRFLEPFKCIERVQVRMFNALAAAPNSFRRSARPVYQALGSLVDSTYLFCQQMAMLDNYSMSPSSRLDFNQEVQAMELKVISASDEAVKREYEEALKSLKARQKQMVQGSNHLSRMEALLAGTEIDLTIIMTDLLGLRGMKKDEIEKQIPELVARVHAEKEHINDFRHSHPCPGSEFT